ncbi:MAG: hypothetical protein NC222_06145 [Staphylococcus sp.]|nr:hypothetical protein [Staphylococcus sp.]
MAFLRKATLQFNKIYASNNGGKYYWRDFVKEANEKMPMDTKDFLPPEAFEYDTKNFVYIQSRAISSMEKYGPNGNGDAFPWEELLKAYPSFIGRGFYIEHIEDSDDDAKGIILDAQPDMDNQFIVCMCAIDRNEYPEICEQITSGKLNQVSMSCLSSRCECSKCHNEATNNAELCSHMTPNSMTYCKNCKDENDELVYEINKDLIFTGLSGVAVPADKDAFVFDIKASKKKETLKDQFNKYIKAKYIEAGAMKRLQEEIKACVGEKTPVERVKEASNILSQALQMLLSNESDYTDCNKLSLAIILQDIVKSKYILEMAVAENELSSPVVETEQPIVEEQPVEAKKVCCNKGFKKLKIASKKKSFWTKLKI